MKTDTIEIQKELCTGDTSRLAKYCELVVGKRGLLSILKYEFITAFGSTPGAVGLAVRAWLYPGLLGSCGKKVTFGRNVVLRHPHKIHVGSNVVIDDNCLLDAKGSDNAGIRIADGVFIGRNSILSCKNGDIELGPNVNIGFNCEIFSASSVSLGANTLVAAYCYFIGGGHDYDSPEIPVLEQGRSSSGIRVAEDAWFGAGAKIMDGVAVGRHSIAGAGAVVTADIPEYAVAVGVPAKVVRDRRKRQSS
jgi:acetyltransferase-like isoleucine patch superfamily enzyme